MLKQDIWQKAAIARQIWFSFVLIRRFTCSAVLKVFVCSICCHQEIKYSDPEWPSSTSKPGKNFSRYSGHSRTKYSGKAWCVDCWLMIFMMPHDAPVFSSATALEWLQGPKKPSSMCVLTMHATLWWPKPCRETSKQRWSLASLASLAKDSGWCCAFYELLSQIDLKWTHWGALWWLCGVPGCNINRHHATWCSDHSKTDASAPGRWLIAIETLGELDLEAMGFWPGMASWHRSMAWDFGTRQGAPWRDQVESFCAWCERQAQELKHGRKRHLGPSRMHRWRG